MKHNISNTFSKIILGLLMLGFASCKIDEIVDPNNPDLEKIQGNATKAEIQNLVSGAEAGMRNSLATYYDVVSVIGREYYRFSGSDPRFTSDLLGKGSAVLDNNTFYLTNPWGARYRTIRNANILIEAVKNTKANLTPEQRNGAYGFAKTIKAYQLLLNLNLLYNNGVRVEVADPDKPGPFLSYAASLEAINALLNEGASDLNNAGSTFAFKSSLASSVISFRKFNRALAARVAIYRENFTEALNLLNESFLDLTAKDLMQGADIGIYHHYSTANNDQINELYLPENSSPGQNARIAHPSFTTGTASNDKRLSKVSKRSTAGSLDGLSGDYDVMLYKSNVAAIPIIRNEELILIYAESKARTGSAGDAVTAINTIRSSAGLPPYTGGLSEGELMEEILYQRRYSLFAEGHRWIDVRRYKQLITLPVDRPGDDIWTEFPRPATEN